MRGIFLAAMVCGIVAPGTVFSATLAGQVLFKGKAPKPAVISTDADPQCTSPDGKPLLSQELEVNPNGTLKDVFVFVKEGAKPVPATNLPPVTIDQAGCHYMPHVLGLRVNQPLRIINSDATFHNVHAVAQINQPFNVGMSVKGQSLDRAFTKPEQMVKIKCDVHGWMAAYVGVMDHPYFAVTDGKGKFVIPDLPAGEYTVEAWQEKLGPKTAKIKVAAGKGTQKLDFTF